MYDSLLQQYKHRLPFWILIGWIFLLTAHIGGSQQIDTVHIDSGCKSVTSFTFGSQHQLYKVHIGSGEKSVTLFTFETKGKLILQQENQGFVCSKKQ